MDEDRLPVVVVGAGPIGLAAAAHLRERGLNPLVLEAGTAAGAAVRTWSHVRLFSPWEGLVDQAAVRLLTPHGWAPPDPGTYPTGGDWVRRYLQPLAEALGPRVRYGARVVGVARRGRDRLVDEGREREPLTVQVRTAAGVERLAARALVDASGTWDSPNPLGGDGLPALGEADASAHIAQRIPDLDDPAVRARYAGRHVAVAGRGHSALTALVALTALAAEQPATRVTWLLRRDATTGTPDGQADALPARSALEHQAAQAVRSGHVRTVTSFRTAAVLTGPDATLTLEAADGRRVDRVDEVLALTGFRPDLTWLSEVRLDLDPTLQAPRALATLIDPNVHTCGTVPRHGADVLTHPEPGVYLVGMKSYGRAPTFLAHTGYEQVRSVAAALADTAPSPVLVPVGARGTFGSG